MFLARDVCQVHVAAGVAKRRGEEQQVLTISEVTEGGTEHSDLWGCSQENQCLVSWSRK